MDLLELIAVTFFLWTVIDRLCADGQPADCSRV